MGTKNVYTVGVRKPNDELTLPALLNVVIIWMRNVETPPVVGGKASLSSPLEP